MNLSISPISQTRTWLAVLSLSAFSVGMASFTQNAAALTVTEELNQLAAEFNTLLDQEIQMLNGTLPDSTIALFDVNTLFANVLPNELDTSQSCVEGPPLAATSAPTSICDNPNDFLLFDEIHPTSAAHSRIADTAIAALAPSTIAQTTNLVIFGDSLTDVGNVLGFSGGTFPFPVAIQGPLAGTPLFTQGAFTNESVWWQNITSAWGLNDPLPYYSEVLSSNFPDSLENGMNFAVGGATTGSDNTGNIQNPPFPIDLPGLQEQLAAFDNLLGETGDADPDALYVVWVGTNNFLGDFVPQDPTNPFGPFQDFTQDPAQPVDDISATVTRLHERGARNFLVGNIYNVGDTPLGRDLELLNTPVQPVPEPTPLVGTLAAAGLFFIYQRVRKSSAIAHPFKRP